MRPLQDAEDHIPSATAAGSVEPMRKADHKAKSHSRPARRSEKLGGGHFVFRRHADGRIHPRQDPFEHADHGAAYAEAARLVEVHGGTFEVFSRLGAVGARAADAAEKQADFDTGFDAAAFRRWQMCEA